jgi:hypothetical protein
MVPPDVRKSNFWYVFIAPPLFRASAVAYSRVGSGLQVCTFWLTTGVILGLHQARFLPPDAMLQQSNANVWLVCRTLNLLPAVRLLVDCLRASLSKIAFCANGDLQPSCPNSIVDAVSEVAHRWELVV